MKYLKWLLLTAIVVGLSSCILDSNNNSITIRNNTYEYITGVYISSTDDISWGGNQLQYIVNPGDSITIYGIPGDSYDILVEADNGLYWTIYNVPVYGGVDLMYDLYYKNNDQFYINKYQFKATDEVEYYYDQTDFKK